MCIRLYGVEKVVQFPVFGNHVSLIIKSICTICTNSYETSGGVIRMK